MKREEYSELKRQPEAKDYRQTMAEAVLIARDYDGSKDAYDKLMEVLTRLEEVIKTSPSLTSDSIRSQEIEAALAFSPRVPRTIDDVLSIAQEGQRYALSQAMKSEDMSGRIQIRKIEGLLLTPDEMAQPITPGTEEFVEADSEPRLEWVLECLQGEGIFTDDILISMGELDSRMMRSTSYMVIEIPKIDRTILVCNLAKEAIFVIGKHVAASEFIGVSKQNLAEMFGNDQVARIVVRGDWRKKIKDALKQSDLSDIGHKFTPTIDIASMEKERVMDSVRKQFTAETWLQIDSAKRRTIIIDGLGLATIAKIVLPNERKKITYRGLNTETMIRAGIEIFGQDPRFDEALDAIEGDVDRWKSYILEQYPTAQDWVNVDYNERRAMVVRGKKINALGNMFGVHGELQSSRVLFLKLGLEIYGKDNPIILKAMEPEAGRKKELERTQEEWSEIFRSEFPVSKDWFEYMSRQGRRGELGELKLHIGVRPLARLFGVPMTSVETTVAHIGIAIYGADDPFLSSWLAKKEKRSEVGVRSIEQWKDVIVQQYPTEQDWLRYYLSLGRVDNMQIDSCGIHTIGRVFGIETYHSSATDIFLSIGMQLYEKHDLIEMILRKKRTESIYIKPLIKAALAAK